MAALADIYNEFLRIAEAGDETAARKYIADHINELPEETRDEILFALMEEALLKAGDTVAGVAEAKQAGIETIQALIKAKKEIENDARIDELQTKLMGGSAA